ncbi:hypothetical protein YUWDRAFT_06761, partial [Streptomyces sp. AmelKG-D3]
MACFEAGGAAGFALDTRNPPPRSQDEYNASGAIPYIFREPETTIAFFDGLEMVEP